MCRAAHIKPIYIVVVVAALTVIPSEGLARGAETPIRSSPAWGRAGANEGELFMVWTLGRSGPIARLGKHRDVRTTERYIGADRKKRLHELVAKRTLALVR
jgi:hypothetical protein